MREIEILIGLLAAVALLGVIAERAGAPHAAVLVLGGLGLGLIPGVPTIRLEPNVVLLGFLPPLVYAAAFRAATFDLRLNAAHILTLATGLVLLTVVAVAAVGRAVAGLPWAAAVVLGALSAPTDPVSASSVMRSVGAPERLVAILEGESLINDGTGLAVFQVAVVAAGSGFSVGDGVLRFVEISAGGCAIGLAGGWLLVRLRRRLDEAPIEIVLSLLTAFGCYTAAQAAGVSGVLAAVAAGLYAGRRAEEMSSAEARLHSEPFFDALTFILESVLFLLIGLQLPSIVSGLTGVGLGTAIAEGAALVAAALAVRAGWMAALGGLRPVLDRVTRSDEGRLTRPELVVLGFSGMRGALSLAGALSIPVLAGRHQFPARDHVIFLVYIVVLGTLVLPSLGLEPLVRRLGLVAGDELRRLELRARLRVVHAGLARLEEMVEEADVPEHTLQRLRGVLELRLERLEARERGIGGSGDDDDAVADGRGADADALVSRLRQEVIAAERQAVAEMRAERRAPTQVLAQIQRDIDLDETRMRR